MDLTRSFNSPSADVVVKIVGHDGNVFYSLRVFSNVLVQSDYFDALMRWPCEAAVDELSSGPPKGARLADGRRRNRHGPCASCACAQEIVETVSDLQEADAVWDVLSLLHVSDVACMAVRAGAAPGPPGMGSLLRMWPVADRIRLPRGRMRALREAIERAAEEPREWTPAALDAFYAVPEIALDASCEAADDVRDNLARVMEREGDSDAGDAWRRAFMLRQFGDVPAALGSAGLRWLLAALPQRAIAALLGADELRVHSENCAAMLVATWDAEAGRKTHQLLLLVPLLRVGGLGASYVANRWLGRFRWVRSSAGAFQALGELSTVALRRLLPGGGGLDAPPTCSPLGTGPARAPSPGRQVIPQRVCKEWHVGRKKLHELDDPNKGPWFDLPGDRAYANGAWFGLHLCAVAPRRQAVAGAGDDEAGLSLGVKLRMRTASSDREEAAMYGPPASDAHPVGHVSATLKLLDARTGAFVEVARFSGLVHSGPFGTDDALGRRAPTVAQLLQPLWERGRRDDGDGDELVVRVEDLCFT